MPRSTRRTFLRNSLVAAGGTAIAGKLGSTALGAPKLGANEKIHIGVAGINGRGGSHIKGFGGVKDVEITYLIDPDSRLFEAKSKQVEERHEKAGKTGLKPPQCVQDVRKALDDKDLDAISIATPNHWHSLMTIWACQAGKDVYVEKPMSHNIFEGRQAVEAARKYERMVQHGTQRRSDRGWAKAIAAVHSGKLGKLLVARALCYKPGKAGDTSTRGDIGYKPHTSPPEGFDWNLWLGPGPAQHYHENLVHYRWHWFWDFGNGDLGNQGVHQMDVARWGIKDATLPKSVVTFGGRIMKEVDQGETANTEMSIMDFGDVQLIFETRGLPSKPYRGATISNIFHLEGGILVEDKWYPEGGEKEAPLPDVEVKMGPGGDEWENFIEAMRSRKHTDLNADVLEGHYSSALCHLANTSIRVGGKIPFRPRTRDFDGNPEALDLLDRTEQYLAENGLDIEKIGYTMGRKLVVDAKRERVMADDEANAILEGFYRKPFIVPKKV